MKVTPPPWYRGGEGVDGAPPLGLCCALTFWRDFAFGCLVESGFDVLYKMRYLLWVGVLLGACDVIQDGGEYGPFPLPLNA